MKHKLVMLALLCSMMPFIMAPGETPPPPPPGPVDCSPGYWKNHTAVWMGKGCGAGLSDTVLLDMLSPQGALGTREDREKAQRILNNCPGLVVNCSD